MNTNYEDFLKSKQHSTINSGFEPINIPNHLFDFQKFIVERAIRKGRYAIFADCGLGKTPMILCIADNVIKKENKAFLIVTPLAVAKQMQREADKFGYEMKRSKEGETFGPVIHVTNYERLHHFDPNDFAGVACDESSAIKAMTGKTRKLVTAFFRKVKYRFLCTATPAPNDYIELGTSSEALGHLGQRDMLNVFFKSTTNLSHVFHKQGDFWNKQKWMFKPHAEKRFWQWVCSWGMAIRKPSDIGFSDERFALPCLNVNQHVVKSENTFGGELFSRVAVTLQEQRQERRNSMDERCAKVAELVNHDKPAIVWGHLNDECDQLEKSIPGSVQVKGSDKDDHKEDTFEAFSNGQARVLITKPSIAGFGMNWQHCHHMTFFPSHSFEQYYQGVRRCWRFGQEHTVNVDIVTTEGEAGVTGNLKRKTDQASLMMDALVAQMNNPIYQNKISKLHTENLETPSWL